MKEKDDWHLTERIDHESGRGDPFAAAIRGTRMPMVITDPRLPDNPIVFANEAFQRLSGYARDEILGRNCRFLQGPSSQPEATQKIRDALAAQHPVNVDILNYRKDGTTFWNALYISPVRGEDGQVQFFFASQLDVTERVDAQKAIAEQKAIVEDLVRARTEDLQLALEAKTTLLHEVDHRVKNNLTMIGSLIRLQLRSLSDPKLRRTLENMLERIDALAIVHRRLYQSDDVTKFDVGAFAKTLVADVLGASGRVDIALKTEIENVQIPARKAAAVGLILNELITNAVKHAYDEGRSGELYLGIRATDGHARIDLRDDGPGFDPSQPAKDSIGRSLIERLGRQLRATTTWNGNAPGTHVSITLPLES